jgi:transposase
MNKDKVNIEKKIKDLLAKGRSERSIAEELQIGRRLVSRIKKGNQELNSVPRNTNSKLNPFKSDIKQWFERDQLNAQQIYLRLCEAGTTVSYETVTRFIKKTSKEEVFIPLITEPGEEGQVDFGYLGEFERHDEKVKVWVFCLVLSFSRYAFYRIVTDQTIETFLQCHKEAFQFFKGTPYTIKLDNLKAGVLQANLYEPTIQPQYHKFLQYYGAQPVACRPRRGSDKGKVEAGIKYIKVNFLQSLRHKDYYRLINDLQHWNKNTCNQRIHGTTKKIPEKLFLSKEKHKLLPLPREPYKFVVIEERKVSNYGHIFFKENHYSVPHQYAGLIVQVKSDGTTLQISCKEVLIAMHTVSHERGTFITNEFHKPPRKQFKTLDHYKAKMERIGEYAIEVLVQLKELRPKHWHSMIRGIDALCKNYKLSDINRACKKALEIKSPNYLTIKQLCAASPISEPQVFTVSNGEEYFDDLSIYDRLINKS